VTWATSVPILVFIGLSVLDLGPMYATDRQTSDRGQSDRRQTASSLNAPGKGGGDWGIIIGLVALIRRKVFGPSPSVESYPGPDCPMQFGGPSLSTVLLALSNLMIKHIALYCNTHIYQHKL